MREKVIRSDASDIVVLIGKSLRTRSGEENVAGLFHDSAGEQDRILYRRDTGDGATGESRAIHDRRVEFVPTLVCEDRSATCIEPFVVFQRRNDRRDGIDGAATVLQDFGACPHRGAQRFFVFRSETLVLSAVYDTGAAVDSDCPVRGFRFRRYAGDRCEQHRDPQQQGGSMGDLSHACFLVCVERGWENRLLLMSNPRKILRTLAAVLLAVLLFGSLAAVSGNGGDRFADWTFLRLKARKMLFFSGSVQLERVRTEAGERLDSETVARFFGAEINQTKTVSRIDPDGRPKRYESRTKKRGRLYLFDDTGYTVQKFAPPKAGWDAPLSSWSEVYSRRFEYPLDKEGRPQRVVDYYTMIRSLAESKLGQIDDEVIFWVATSDGPRDFTVTVSAERIGERRVRGADDRKKTLRRREFRLRIAPRDPANAREGFLSMEGETELWVDAKTRTLLEVSGRVPKVPGRVVLTLNKLY